ncbi:MAG TPA: hypothetical protein HA224_02615 [Nanoarchaeota archaeon]|nr:hypothetical protein [Nanoarchaeota archaeon]
MAKLNLNIIVLLVALVIVGYSFSQQSTGWAIAIGAGAPANTVCTDGDGLNTSIFGSCTDSAGLKKTDKCMGANAVQETYCSPSNICSYKPLNCAYGEMCVGGVCKAV